MRKPTFCRLVMWWFAFLWARAKLDQSVCWDNGFDFNQRPAESINHLRFRKPHIRTIKKPCRMPARSLTVASSEQASLLTGRSWTKPKRGRRDGISLFFCLSIPLPFSHPQCLCQSQAYSLWPLSLFFSPLFFSHWAVNRLHCSLSQCQSSASEPQVKH